MYFNQKHSVDRASFLEKNIKMLFVFILLGSNFHAGSEKRIFNRLYGLIVTMSAGKDYELFIHYTRTNVLFPEPSPKFVVRSKVVCS